jgi:hypothetical protein
MRCQSPRPLPLPLPHHGSAAEAPAIVTGAFFSRRLSWKKPRRSGAPCGSTLRSRVRSAFPALPLKPASLTGCRANHPSRITHREPIHRESVRINELDGRAPFGVVVRLSGGLGFQKTQRACGGVLVEHEAIINMEWKERAREVGRDVAYDRWNNQCEVVTQITEELVETTPTTMAGLAALLTYWSEIMDEDTADRDFLKTSEFLEKLGLRFGGGRS